MDSITEKDVERMTAEMDVAMVEAELDAIEEVETNPAVIRRERQKVITQYGQELKSNIKRKTSRTTIRDGQVVQSPLKQSSINAFALAILSMQGLAPRGIRSATIRRYNRDVAVFRDAKGRFIKSPV